ncbi:methyltransferase [Streptomyces sp. AcH 505]|uniref:SAM-dependent methyltransferase n=1 Tax=Streptomyces sp. AcH 505 TaxID=352211 RepID=UPI000591CCBF|nr:methyltransferase [Streptomyces sp. AcH 505]
MTTGTPKPQVDTSRPHPARVYDYLLGGKDNYQVDRVVGEQLPELGKDSARQNRAFMHRAVGWLAANGVDQFLDIGTGIPTEPNLHQVVQRTVPRARVVYTDNDPIVLRHAEALLVGTAEGATDYIEADVRDPAKILDHARKLLDFDRPIALSLIALMHFIPDEDDPYGLAGTLLEALPSGSYLALSHGTFDFSPELKESITGTYGKGGIALRFRARDEVARFFDGLDLVEPGLVTAHRWYRDTPEPPVSVDTVYGGVARVR